MSGTANVAEIDRWNEVHVGEAKEIISDAIAKRFRRTIFLWGQRGIGKSEIVHQAASENGALLVDKRLSLLDPADVRGVMMGSIDNRDAVTVNATKYELAKWLLNPDFFPTLEKDQGLVIFLDEFNHANDMLQKAAYELAWDHSIGGVKFPEGTVVILAGNRESENANVTPLDKPMRRRAIHLYARFDYETFWNHAMNRGGYHPLVLGWLKERPDKANNPIDEDVEYYGEPLPASWEVVSDILRTFQKNTDKLVAGAIGVGEAVEFRAWAATAGQLTPLIDKIQNGSNDTAGEMSEQFFVCQSLVERYRRTDKLAKRILDYAISIKKKFPEMGGVMIQSAYVVNKDALKATGSWKKAMLEYARFIA